MSTVRGEKYKDDVMSNAPVNELRQHMPSKSIEEEENLIARSWLIGTEEMENALFNDVEHIIVLDRSSITAAINSGKLKR
jgi:hypothetical protein